MFLKLKIEIVLDPATKLCAHEQVTQSQIISTIKWGHNEDPIGESRFKYLKFNICKLKLL